MKKLKLFVLLTVCLLVVSGIAVAQGASNRYLVKSNSKALKVLFGVQHKFEQGFTTELTGKKLGLLKRLGIEVEEIPQYSILVKPVCGDNVCQGNEPRTCPQDCAQTPPEPTPRTCLPNSAVPYGIAMVNGASGGAGVNVAVLDTGVQKDHPDLNVKLCMDATKRGIKKGCTDQNGHGTHVAGTIAANSGDDGLGIYGVSPEANLWAIKVCGPSGSCWSDDIAEGIRYAADQGAEIISLSLGGNTLSILIKDAIGYAMSKGVLVVAAAGNDGPDEGSIDYPAAIVDVVAVGAIDFQKYVPSWSSRGINNGDYIMEEREVWFGAPGVGIESTWNDGCYKTISGTSMATPHMAGVIAKVWQGSAEATMNYIRDPVMSQDLHFPGDDSATGLGLLVAP